MADSKFSKEKVGEEVPKNQTFAVSGKRLEKQCQPCSTAEMCTKAEYWCVDCSEYMCLGCSKTHTRFAISRDHQIVASSAAAEPSGLLDIKGTDQCKEHSKKLKFVCENDDMLCCSTCAITKHRKCHNVEEIEHKAKTKAPDLTSITRDLLDIESNVTACTQRLIYIRDKVTTDAAKITKRIQEMQDKMNEMFENLKRNVAKEIHSFQQKVFQDLDMKNEVCISNVTCVTEALSDVANVLQQGTPSQQLIMAHHLNGQVSTLKVKIDQDISDLKDINMSFDFDQSMQLPPVNNTTTGKLTMKFVPFDVITPSESMNSEHEDQKVKLTLLASIDLKQCEGDVGKPLYSGLDFLSDGRLVAVDNKNKKCLVYNQKLEKMGSVLLPDTPFDVTVMTDEKVAVSSGRKIAFINISKSSDLTVTRTLTVTMNCDSICMMTDDSFLVGIRCYKDPQPIRVLSVQGEERPLAINFPSKQFKPDESWYTYSKNRNKIVLSDRFAHTVYIYDIANNTSVDVKDEKIIKEPRGVAIGLSDCIFVCSKYTNSIVEISHTGQILSSHVLDMLNPRSVCVSKDNTQLAVSNNANGKMKLQLLHIELI